MIDKVLGITLLVVALLMTRWWYRHVALPVYNWLERWRTRQRGQFIMDETRAWYQCPLLTPHDPHGKCPGKTFPGRPT